MAVKSIFLMFCDVFFLFFFCLFVFCSNLNFNYFKFVLCCYIGIDSKQKKNVFRKMRVLWEIRILLRWSSRLPLRQALTATHRYSVSFIERKRKTNSISNNYTIRQFTRRVFHWTFWSSTETALRCPVEYNA